MSNEQVIITETVKAPRNINYQFKVLYVMIMFCVLCGHMLAVDKYIPWNDMISVYGFGIQLFLFISGYFYNKKADVQPLKFILKKLKTVILPYFLWNLFYGIVCLILKKSGFTFCSHVTVKSLFVDVFISGPSGCFNSPSWFILPFFYAEIFCVLERWLLSKFDTIKKEIFLLAINFVIGSIGVYCAIKGYNDGGYYEGKYKLIFQTMFMIPYFSLGYIYKMYLEKKDTLSSFWYFSILLFLQLGFLLVYRNPSSYFVAVMGGFENPVVPIFTSVVGIAFFLRVSRILTPVMGRSKYINLIADNTFGIMANHIFGFFLLSGIMVLASKYISFLPAADMKLFFSDINYRYMPRFRGFPMLYVWVGFTVSIFMQKTATILNRKLVSKFNFKK